MSNRNRRPAALRLLTSVLGALMTGAVALSVAVSGAQAPAVHPRVRRCTPTRRRRRARRCTGSRAPRCHGATLTGGTAPPLTGPAFEASWSDPRVTLADVFFIARTTMPPRASNSLSAQDHAAVFAYILKTNGFPPGATPLTAASAAAGSRAPRDREVARGAAGTAGVHSRRRRRGAGGQRSGSGDADAAPRNRPTGCFTPTTTAARASRRFRRSTRRQRRGLRRRACSRSASATIFRPGRSSTTARCTSRR